MNEFKEEPFGTSTPRETSFTDNESSPSVSRFAALWTFKKSSNVSSVWLYCSWTYNASFEEEAKPTGPISTTVSTNPGNSSIILFDPTKSYSSPANAANTIGFSKFGPSTTKSFTTSAATKKEIKLEYTAFAPRASSRNMDVVLSNLAVTNIEGALSLYKYLENPSKNAVAIEYPPMGKHVLFSKHVMLFARFISSLVFPAASIAPSTEAYKSSSLPMKFVFDDFCTFSLFTFSFAAQTTFLVAFTPKNATGVWPTFTLFASSFESDSGTPR